MKKSATSFLVPLAMLMMIAFGAQAQDDGITSQDLQNTRVDVIEHENRTTRNLVATRDSLQMSDFYQKPKSVDRRTSTSGADEDDALSLNFLFYIIENYKFSDLMDK